MAWLSPSAKVSAKILVVWSLSCVLGFEYMPCHGMLKKLLFHWPIRSIESIFGNQNTWPEHNKGVAPIPHPHEIGPLGVGATIVFVASDIVSFSQGVRAIQLGP